MTFQYSYIHDKRMLGFLRSFLPFINKYKIETIFISLALFVTIISLSIFFLSNSSDSEEINNEEISSNQLSSNQLFKIDVSGAVLKPDMYEVTPGARLKDIILLAGGLTENADKQYFSRNFNLSRLINDQDKIYIPSTLELNNAIFTEIQRTLDYISPGEVSTDNVIQNQSAAVNINSATIEELDKLPGVGKTTTQKIIQNRPYKTVADLVTKKVVKKNVYEKIKGLITL